MSKSLVTVKIDNMTSGTQDVDLHRWWWRHRLNGLIPDQNLRNDVVTPKIVLSFRITYDDGFV